jgi:ribosome-binding factor A
MIGSTLQQELMGIIMRELNDPRLAGFPSITRVKVSPDLAQADVYVTIMGSEGKQTAALNALKHSAGMMRQKLQKTLPMRTIPFLKFHIDENLKRELSVLELIDKAVKEEDELKATREPSPADPLTDAAADAPIDAPASPQAPADADASAQPEPAAATAESPKSADDASQS